jgi:hypothetical protein
MHVVLTCLCQHTDKIVCEIGLRGGETQCWDWCSRNDETWCWDRRPWQRSSSRSLREKSGFLLAQFAMCTNKKWPGPWVILEHRNLEQESTNLAALWARFAA